MTNQKIDPMWYPRLPTTRSGFKLMLAFASAATAAGFIASLMLIYFGADFLGANVLAAAECLYLFLFLSLLRVKLGGPSNGEPFVQKFFCIMLPPLGLQTIATLIYGDIFQAVTLAPAILLWLILTWITQTRGLPLFANEPTHPR